MPVGILLQHPPLGQLYPSTYYSLSPSHSTISICSQRTFTFDHIFPLSSTGQQVFKKNLKSQIDNILDGHSSCCFACGDRLNYTLFGRDEAGLLLPCLEYLFQSVQNKTKSKVFCSLFDSTDNTRCGFTRG